MAPLWGTRRFLVSRGHDCSRAGPGSVIKNEGKWSICIRVRGVMHAVSAGMVCFFAAEIFS